jgi:hypothetical protein
MKFARSAVASAAAFGLIGLGGIPASADDHVLVDNVVSPLAFSIGDDGTVYVSESFIGQLTAVSKKGVRSTVASNEGGFMGGVEATGKGTLTYTVSSPPEFEFGPPTDTSIHRVKPNGTDTLLASLLAYEEENNPDAGNLYGILDPGVDCAEAAALVVDFIGPPANNGGIDSNPYSVAIDSDGSRLVGDAAGNSIIRVSANGRQMSTVAVLPPVAQTLSSEALAAIVADINAVLEEMELPLLPEDVLEPCAGEPFASEPVPTDIEIGPDGNYYVSSLPGFPESPGAGSVFRIDRSSGSVTQIATGFTGATDLAVAEDGTIYVAELFGFQVARIDPGDSSASDAAFVECPSAVEIGPDGHVYVAEAGICTDGPPAPGRIVRLDL